MRDEIDDENERTEFRHNHAKDRNHSSAYDDMIKRIKEEKVKSFKVSEKTTFFEGAISFGVKIYTSKKFRNFIFFRIYNIIDLKFFSDIQPMVVLIFLLIALLPI